MKMLSNKEKKILIEELKKILKIDLDYLKKEDIFFYEDKKIYLCKKIPIAFVYENKIFPTIFLIANLDTQLPYVIVDNGAREKILNGADVFRPGILEFDENIKKDDIVLILSMKKELLGIGTSLMDSDEIKKSNKGRVLKNINYYGDFITKLYFELNSK